MCFTFQLWKKNRYGRSALKFCYIEIFCIEIAFFTTFFPFFQHMRAVRKVRRQHEWPSIETIMKPIKIVAVLSILIAVLSILIQFLRQFYTDLFETLHMFPPWSEDVHVVWIWSPPSEFVSSSIPSWQILTAHAQTFRGARDLAFCLKVPLDSLLLWASSGGSGETARMRRLAWTFAARIGDKYQIRLTRSI